MHSSPAASQRACLTVNEAAELARVTPKTVRKWIAAGELRALKAGRSHRVDRDELVTFMAAGPKPKEADHTPEQLAVIHLRRQSG
ncbi:MAG: helix-turn-helix domain-containing protein [Deltaproteobacteria bacterium]|nr:helix-turn-helix domain-containing protein [Deltaproteobacteria bacterium]